MPKKDWKKNSIPKIFSKDNLWPWKKNELVSILDVACGLSLKSKYIPAKIRVGVDIYEKYFKYIESDEPYLVIKYDVRNLEKIFIPNSFDLVLALDIIEHLEKKESKKMIKQCEKIAKKAVVLETPNGKVEQNIDITGHGGHTFQTHRCGWTPDELKKMGYKTIVRDYQMSNVKRHTQKTVNTKIELIDAIKFIK